MKTSAAGEGCPRSAATEGRGHGNAAGSIRGKSRDLCTKIISIPVDPAAAARPERPRTAAATMTGGKTSYVPICNHPSRRIHQPNDQNSIQEEARVRPEELQHHIHSQIIQVRVYLPLRYSLFSVRESGLVQLLSRRACVPQQKEKKMGEKGINPLLRTWRPF